MDVKSTDLPAFDLNDGVTVKPANDVTTFSKDVITISKDVISVLRHVTTRANDQQLTAENQRIVGLTSDYVYDAQSLNTDSHVSASSSSIVIHFSVVAALFVVVLLLTFVNLWLKKFQKNYDGRCVRSSSNGRDDNSSRSRRKSWNERISLKGNDACPTPRKTTLKMNANAASFV